MTTRVLVIRFSSLGDVVLAAPVFPAIKKLFPGVRTSFLTKSEFGDLHRGNPDLDEVWVFDAGSESFSSLIQRVRRSDFDLVVDLHGSLRSRIITLLAGTSTVHYRKERWRRFWLVARPPFKRRKELIPVVDRYLMAVGLEEPGGPERVPILYLDSEKVEKGLRWREELVRGREGRLIALMPAARHPPKEWPLYHFTSLARLIHMRGDLPVVIYPPERPELADVIADQEGVTLLRDSFEHPVELGAALKAVDGVVTNDSGPMHLAAAVGTNTVGLFGPTSPELGFEPAGEHASHLYLRLYCSPCSKHGQRVCWRSERKCMMEIEPREVIDVLDRLIGLE